MHIVKWQTNPRNNGAISDERCFVTARFTRVHGNRNEGNNSGHCYKWYLLCGQWKRYMRTKAVGWETVVSQRG
jgi:hypothetical protein